jgi:DHA1 family tetracycline resistance protein-like MFS transporter
MASSTVAYVLYGLAFQGWMMYAIILGNMLGFVINPALQGIVSKAVDPRHQGITLGSLNSISSIMGVIAPLVGTPLLAQVSGLPATDWRVGIVFFLAALGQGVAFMLAYFHFRKTRVKVSLAEPA